ncbi:MAG: hypothetical protein ACLFR6_08245 [Salinarchaeum sp.]
MTAHRLRLVHSQSGADDFHAWLESWLTNMSPWDYPEVDNDLPTLREPVDGESYYQAELAFDWSEDESIILDNLDDYAASYCDWHRIGYHVCEHDESDPTPCSWDTDLGRKSGSVPDHIPTFDTS